MGENRQTARIYGIKSDRIKITMFAVSALAAAIGGILIPPGFHMRIRQSGWGLSFSCSQQRFLEEPAFTGEKAVFLVRDRPNIPGDYS